MLAGSLRSRWFTLTTGEASVSPYPWQIGNPSPMNMCAICGLSAAPPLMHRRSFPPRRSRSFFATRARSKGHARNDARHSPRFWRHSNMLQPTPWAISKSLRRHAGQSLDPVPEGAAPASADWIVPCRRSNTRGTDTITVGRTTRKSSASCPIERAKATVAPAAIVR